MNSILLRMRFSLHVKYSKGKLIYFLSFYIYASETITVLLLVNNYSFIEHVHMTSLRQYNSTTKFWLAKYCMFHFDVEEWEPRKAIMVCQPKWLLLVNINMLYTKYKVKIQRKNICKSMNFLIKN